VLGHGSAVPEVKWAGAVSVPRDDQAPIMFDLELRPDETDWLVVRISDPSRVDKAGRSAMLGDDGAALAYSSPFFLRPSG
jgi:hypothetical protein